MEENTVSTERVSSTHAQTTTPAAYEKETSSAVIGSLSMGAKKTSLYLSRTKSLLKSPSKLNHESAYEFVDSQASVSQSVDRQDSTLDDATSVTSNSVIPSFPKEFTFTGYDIMADEEPEIILFPKKKEKPPTKTDLEKAANVQLYKNACKKLGLNPVNYAVRHINDRELKMNSHPLGPDGTRALCIALVFCEILSSDESLEMSFQDVSNDMYMAGSDEKGTRYLNSRIYNNRFVRILSLEDNDLGAEGASSVVEMLSENDRITDVFLAENLIGTRGIFAFTELMKDGKDLHTLDLSGSNLEDNDGKYVAQIIELNKNLKVFKVSHNKLGEESGFDIGRALAINDVLQELDLSWNHFRGQTSLAIAMGVQRNAALKVLNLAWNGFALTGSKGIGEALVHNTTLKELDMSNNRIGVESIGHILKGLQQNSSLKLLKISQNLFSPEVAMTILKSIYESETCVLTVLDLSDVVVREDFIKLVEEIKEKRPLPLRVMHGASVKSLAVKPAENYGIDWRDPVTRMYKFMTDKGYRVIDLLKRLDKDRNFSVDREEFKQGLIAEEIPMTESQLDEVVDILDTDGDGEVDFSELVKGEKDFKKKMRARMKVFMKNANTIDAATRKLRRIQEL